MAELPSSRESALSAAPAAPLALLRLLRPRQWTKNLLLFAALVFAERLFDAGALLEAALGFVAFCAASSSVYVVNDLLDAERDRRHPEKRLRPIASGAVSRGAAGAVAVLLTFAALGLGLVLGPAFTAWTGAYLALSHFYSMSGKNVVILDVMLIASGFVIRAIAGAAAIDVPFSDWFVLCTLFVAVFIATCKRKAELLGLGDAADGHRPVLARYTTSALDAFIATAMAAALMCYALYVREHSGGEMRLLALTVPFVIFGLFRYSLLVETSRLADKPEEVFLQDRPMQVCVLGFAVVAVAALYLRG